MTRDFKHSFKTAQRPELSLAVYNAGFQKCPPLYGWGPGIRDHYLIHPNTAALLEKLLLMLRDEGEARTLAYIRRELVGRGGASS